MGLQWWNEFFVDCKLKYRKNPFEWGIYELLEPKCGFSKLSWSESIFEHTKNEYISKTLRKTKEKMKNWRIFDQNYKKNNWICQQNKFFGLVHPGNWTATYFVTICPTNITNKPSRNAQTVLIGKLTLVLQFSYRL